MWNRYGELGHLHVFLGRHEVKKMHKSVDRHSDNTSQYSEILSGACMGQIQICSSHAQSGYQLLGIHLMQKIQSINEIRKQKLKTERVAASCAECNCNQNKVISKQRIPPAE
jgi:hypothetical protein